MKEAVEKKKQEILQDMYAEKDETKKKQLFQQYLDEEYLRKVRDIRSRASKKIEDVIKSSPFYRPPEELPKQPVPESESEASELES